jgi:DNA-binding GntR family transcriptional regulator
LGYRILKFAHDSAGGKRLSIGYGIPNVDSVSPDGYRLAMQTKSLQPLRRTSPLRDRIHDRLRTAIISGELSPGTPVIEAELATRLGASRTPVREALRRLEAEGLLEPRGLRGSVVRELRSDEVDCVFEIREALESLAARRAARSMRDTDVRKLQDCVDRMRVSVDDANEMERHDTAFHDVILASASGDRLKRMLTELREELIAYRFLSLSDAERRRATIAEHDAIVEAMRARDENAAAARTAAHIANARAAVLRLAAASAASPAASAKRREAPAS